MIMQSAIKIFIRLDDAFVIMMMAAIPKLHLTVYNVHDAGGPFIQ